MNEHEEQSAVPRRNGHLVNAPPIDPVVYEYRRIYAELIANEIRRNMNLPQCIAVGRPGDELRFVDVKTMERAA